MNMTMNINEKDILSFSIAAGAMFAVSLIYKPSQEEIINSMRSSFFSSLGSFTAGLILHKFAEPEIVLLKQ